MYRLSSFFFFSKLEACLRQLDLTQFEVGVLRGLWTLDLKMEFDERLHWVVTAILTSNESDCLQVSELVGGGHARMFPSVSLVFLLEYPCIIGFSLSCDWARASICFPFICQA